MPTAQDSVLELRCSLCGAVVAPRVSQTSGGLVAQVHAGYSTGEPYPVSLMAVRRASPLKESERA